MVKRTMATITIIATKTGRIRLYRVIQQNNNNDRTYNNISHETTSNHSSPFVNRTNPHSDTAEAKATSSGRAMRKFNMITVQIVATKIVDIFPATLIFPI